MQINHPEYDGPAGERLKNCCVAYTQAGTSVRMSIERLTEFIRYISRQDERTRKLLCQRSFATLQANTPGTLIRLTKLTCRKLDYKVGGWLRRLASTLKDDTHKWLSRMGFIEPDHGQFHLISALNTQR